LQNTLLGGVSLRGQEAGFSGVSFCCLNSYGSGAVQGTPLASVSCGKIPGTPQSLCVFMSDLMSDLKRG